ncbi:MAG: HEAT repeat domain-containing protein [Gemmatimonadaceae bacterium]
MTVAARVARRTGTDISEVSPSPAVVEAVCQALAKAMRAHQLYLPNNPMYHRAIEQLSSTFAGVWAHTDEITLVISESALRYEGQTVFVDTSGGESLPWTFYKDGLRGLTFLTGFEREEVVRLLALLQRVRRASQSEEDLLTLLWEQDFLFLRYRFVDVALDGVCVPEPASTPGRLPGADQQAPASPPAADEVPAFVQMKDFDSTLYFLDERDIEYVRAALAAEYEGDSRANVLAILFDLFEIESSEAARDGVIDIVGQLYPLFLADADFQSAALAIREARIAADRTDSAEPSHRQRLRRAADQLSAPDTVAQLIQALDDSETTPPDDALSALFDALLPAALGPVLAGLGRVRSVLLRDALGRAAARLAAANTAELVRLIESRDVAVALEAIRGAGRLRSAAAVVPLSRTLAGPEQSLRLAALLALGEIASPSALRHVESVIEDPDRDVRVTAVRIVGMRNHRAALPRLQDVLRSGWLREADLTELMAYYEAFGALAGGDGVEPLDATLNGRSMFGRREDAETRACSALALGRIGTAEAIAALRRASADKDLVVRNAVAKALRGGT